MTLPAAGKILFSLLGNQLIYRKKQHLYRGKLLAIESKNL